MRPLQGNLPYNDTNDKEQNHQSQQPGAETFLLPGSSQSRHGAVALQRLPHPKPIFFLGGISAHFKSGPWLGRHDPDTTQKHMEAYREATARILLASRFFLPELLAPS